MRRDIMDPREVQVELPGGCGQISGLRGDYPSPEGIISAVSGEFGVTVKAIRGRAHDKEVVRARHVAAYLLRELLDPNLRSFPRVGRFLGGKHHSTIMYACRMVEEQTDPEFWRRLRAVKARFQRQQ